MDEDLSQATVVLLVRRRFRHEKSGAMGYVDPDAVGYVEDREGDKFWVRFPEAALKFTMGSVSSVSLLLEPDKFIPTRPFSLIDPSTTVAAFSPPGVQPLKQETTEDKRVCLACNRAFFYTICPFDGTALLQLGVRSEEPFDAQTFQTRLGKMELAERVASGYSANVYKAKSCSDNAVYAVKFLLKRFVAKEIWLAGFNKEAEALASLSHPNLVTLYDSGSVDKQPYLVLEFINGSTVSRLVETEGPISAKQIRDWFIPVCDALSYITARGVLHEDLKSTDIMVDVENNTAKIIDLGKARPIGHLHGTTSLQGAFSGNVNYTAPERCMGRTSYPYTYKANIYSLGCILYECVCKRPPFTGKTIVDVAMKQMSSQPEDLMSCNPQPPAELNKLILSMLAKTPVDRPEYEQIKSVLLTL